MEEEKIENSIPQQESSSNLNWEELYKQSQKTLTELTQTNTRLAKQVEEYSQYLSNANLAQPVKEKTYEEVISENLKKIGGRF